MDDARAPIVERWDAMNTPTKLLHAFRTVNPTSPRLTWYGPDGERVEFSGRVLENWVAKTANYLVDELDAEPGTVIALDVPLHWRSLVWLLATWAVGATAATAGAASSGLAAGADIIATTDPAAVHATLSGAKGDPLVVAVALPALQMRWMGELPPRTLDYSGDVRSHADVFFADAEPDSSDIAWRQRLADGASAVGARTDGASTDGASADTSYAQLLADGGPQLAGAGVPLPTEPQRVLLQVRDGWAAVVPDALKIWAAGGSVVLIDGGVAASEALRTSENITLG